MAKREKNPASDKTGNDTGVSLLVLGIACKSAEKK